MNAFAQTVTRLIESMETGNLPGTEDSQTLQLLHAVRDHALNGHAEALDVACNHLREHWLHAVAWCSDLSRELEKILMIYEDEKTFQTTNPNIPGSIK